MPHRSWVARTSDGLLRLIPQLFGFGLVKHKLHLELFPSIIELVVRSLWISSSKKMTRTITNWHRLQEDPFSSVVLNISSSEIELYDARLVITAKMSRIVFAVKYHWIASSFAAVCITMAMFCAVFAACWVGSWLYMITTSIANHFNNQVAEPQRPAAAPGTAVAAVVPENSQAAAAEDTTTLKANTTEPATVEEAAPASALAAVDDDAFENDGAGTSASATEQQATLSELRKRH